MRPSLRPPGLPHALSTHMDFLPGQVTRLKWARVSLGPGVGAKREAGQCDSLTRAQLGAREGFSEEVDSQPGTLSCGRKRRLGQDFGNRQGLGSVMAEGSLEPERTKKLQLTLQFRWLQEHPQIQGLMRQGQEEEKGKDGGKEGRRRGGKEGRRREGEKGKERRKERRWEGGGRPKQPVAL